MAREPLTAERLRALLSYDPETGAFAWRPRPGRAGAKVGSMVSPGYVSELTGYLAIRVDGRLYQAHRLAWLHKHGAWPEFEIDHRDRDRTNNRISNLRDVAGAINVQNIEKARVDSSTGVRGVRWNKRRGTFDARIRVHGRSYSLGSFGTLEAGRGAYLAAKALLHPGWVPSDGFAPPSAAVDLTPRARARRDSRSGVKGVQFHRQSGKWCARMTVAGRCKHIGLFPSIEAASAAYADAVRAHG